METTDYALMDKLSQLNQSIYRYGNLSICIVGNLGNILSLSVFLKHTWLKNVCVFYFLIFILTSTTYLNCTILGLAMMNGFDINVQNSNLILCKVFFYITMLCTTLVPTVLILASIDRLLISSQKVDTRLYSSKRLAYFSIGLSTCFWLLYNLHILIRTDIQQPAPGISFCYYNQNTIYQAFVFYSLMIFNTSFCVITIVLTIFAFQNVRQIRSIPRQKRDRVRSMTKKDFQLLRCLFVLVIVYISCSIIPSGFSMYDTITRTRQRTVLQQSIHNFLYNTLNVLYYLYHATSFFIFFIISKAFRQELKRNFYKIFGLNLDTTATTRSEDVHPQKELSMANKD